MKLHYYAETDSLYIDLADAPSADSTEVAEGVVLDFDASGKLCGIDIDHASRYVDLSRVDSIDLPVSTFTGETQAATAGSP